MTTYNLNSSLLNDALYRVAQENQRLGAANQQALLETIQEEEAEKRKQEEQAKQNKEFQKKAKDEYLKRLREKNKQNESPQQRQITPEESPLAEPSSPAGTETGSGIPSEYDLASAGNTPSTGTENIVGPEGGAGSGGADAMIEASGEGIGEGLSTAGSGAGIGEGLSTAGSGAGSWAGSGGGGAAAGGGLGAGWIAAIIAAVIAAQHYASNETDTKVEGVRTDDAFGGHFGTQPYQAWAYERLGMPASSGERFDAAVENSDWGTALERLPDTADYWAHPATHSLKDVEYEGMKRNFGEGSEKVLGVFDPLAWVLRWIAGEND